MKANARQKYFDYLEKHGKLPKRHDDEMELEEMPHMAHGGMVSPDEEMGEMDEFDSSGEPHTDDLMEDEDPMEYMNKGGLVKRLSKGPRMHNASFARALKKHY